ncbi:antitoxin [Phaeacidiphilus oryzae]|uniref:antitoxin n=1 Tax=Phaeacidiphilus oryzae TaxID=348818 RepID=UPI000560EE19|nr:antitoxin [Phaeacidiphilus oryzae]
MSGLGDFARKAEEWAEDNPEIARKGIDRAEAFAQDQTGHRFDDQISAGADQLANRFTGDGQEQQGRQDGGDRSEGYGSQENGYQDNASQDRQQDNGYGAQDNGGYQGQQDNGYQSGQQQDGWQ